MMRERKTGTDKAAVGPGESFVPSPELREFLEAAATEGKVLKVPAEGGTMWYVPFGEGRALPLSFNYYGASGLVSFHMVVQVDPSEDGRPRCVRLNLEARPGEFIKAQTLRLPFGELLEEAVLFSAIELDSQGRPVGGPIGERVTSLADARKLHHRIEREYRRRARGTKRKGRVDDAKLREVARIYRAGMAKTPPRPAADVHEAFPHNGRSTIGRWIKLARKAGYLGDPPAPGVAGEIYESTAKSDRKEEQ